MSIILNDNLDVRAPKPVDRRYVALNGIPYTGVTQVNTEIDVSYRFRGLTVNVNGTEYWYSNGTDDSDLVLKGSGGGSGERIEKQFTQSLHGFTVGDVVGYSGGTFVKALANVDQDIETIGIVSLVNNVNNFTVTFAGYLDGLGGLGLLANKTYFLDDNVAGNLRGTEPTALGSVSLPILTTFSSSTALIYQYRPIIVDTGATSGGGGSSSGNLSVIITTGATVNIPNTVKRVLYVASGTSVYNFPSAPAVGTEIYSTDGQGNAYSTNITLNGNGYNLADDTSAKINTDNGTLGFIFNGLYWTLI